MRSFPKILSLILLICLTSQRRLFQTFEINLDLPMNERYIQVVDSFNDTLHTQYEFLMTKFAKGLFGKLAQPISEMRGPENPEL